MFALLWNAALVGFVVKTKKHRATCVYVLIHTAYSVQESADSIEPLVDMLLIIQPIQYTVLTVFMCVQIVVQYKRF